MQSIDSFCVGKFKMYPKISICLFFLAGTSATKIDIAENQNLRADVKTCLSTVIEKVCPGCRSGYFVTPVEPAWEAEALIGHFFHSLPMYAMVINTMDHPGYEDPVFNEVGLYLVNTEADLMIASENLRAASLQTNHVVWVNFDFGHDLGSYLGNTIPAIWEDDNGLSVIFIAWVEGDIQVFLPTITTPGSLNATSLRKLSICNTKDLVQVSQPQPKVIETQGAILTVTLIPSMLPYIERRTDNPGGFIGELMNVLKSRLHFTPKYVWDIRGRDLQNFAQGDDGLCFALNLRANPKRGSPFLSAILMAEGVWMITTPYSVDRRNYLALPFKYSMFLHTILLAIYTIAMVYFSRDLDKSRITLRLFGMFFGIGVGWFPRKALFRFLVVLWCFTSYVLVQAYLAQLTSDLSSPIVNRPLRDTDDLMKSGMDLFCTKEVKELYCNLDRKASVYICKKCVLVDQDFMQQFRQIELSMNKTKRPFAMALDTRVFKSNFGSRSVVMEQQIGIWPTGIYANMDTELLHEMVNISSKLQEAGIFHYWLSQYDMNNVDDEESGHEMLTMSHLNDVFIILYVGWSCSIFVFIIEIFTKWYGNN